MKLVFIAVLSISCILFFSAKPSISEDYKCLPCGQECDNTVHKESGKCSVCSMPLVKASTITFKTIEPDKICDYIKEHPTTILLDVRTKEEFEGKANPNFGSLQNAINIPIQELEQRTSELDKFKNREIIVYCSHSHRSPRASYMLTQHGFSNVINMAGGMSVLPDGKCKK
jgi:rhodanese-related sulfurtransferase